MVIGKEIGDNGTPHLQGFVYFNKQVSFVFMKKLFPRCHLEIAVGSDQQASDYCKKSDKDAFEKGSFKTNQGKRTDLESVALKIKAGVSMSEIVEENPLAFIYHGRGLLQYSLFVQQPYEHNDVRGEWFYGPPGSGKSRFAREQNPKSFLKSQNKWFDGYLGQDTIILDDLDKLGGQTLGHYLKIWTDRYSCTGETKGGTVHLRHSKFIVTSNYKIEELWPDDSTLCDALNRRFKVTHFDFHAFNPFKKIKLN